MPETIEVRVPTEYVNDLRVLLVHAYVAEGGVVQAGQVLADVETSKAVVEISAPASGPVAWAVGVGQEIEVGGVLCYIGGRPESSKNPLPPGGEARSTVLSGTRFSKKALDLIESHGLDPSAFAGRALVRGEDVEEVLRRRDDAADRAGLPAAFGSLSLSGVTLPEGWKAKGTIDPSLSDELRHRPAEFARLSSREKIELYRKHGALVGDDVVLGEGALIWAPEIVLGDGVQLGARADVRCRDRFVAGPLTSFGPDLSVRGGSVVFGSNVYGGKSVEIGGGGHADPWSLLSVGDTTYVGDQVFINICRPVVLGKEVFLTQRSILVTHNIGHSILEGYENRFAPIVLEDACQVGMNCTIYAGARLGRGSIVVSNSYVLSGIPEGKLAMGVPARVVREASRPLDRPKQLETAQRMVHDFAELLRAKGFEVNSQAHESGFTVNDQGKTCRLQLVESLETWKAEKAGHEAVLWVLENRQGPAPEGWSVMSLLSKRISGPGGRFVESAREFLRKRGIRLEPGPWRYRGGLI